MAKIVKVYTDIGHDDPRDVIWLYREGRVDQMTAGGEFTHEKLYGLVRTENSWRGRYEVSTGYCSIAAPLSQTGRHPPKILTDMLSAAFSVTKFHIFYGHVVESFSPNPER